MQCWRTRFEATYNHGEEGEPDEEIGEPVLGESVVEIREDRRDGSLQSSELASATIARATAQPMRRSPLGTTSTFHAVECTARASLVNRDTDTDANTNAKAKTKTKPNKENNYTSNNSNPMQQTANSLARTIVSGWLGPLTTMNAESMQLSARTATALVVCGQDTVRSQRP
eukprot:1996097-Rhodomonas_salina.3